MVNSADVIRAKFAALREGLDERMRRTWAATEAIALGRGGATQVAEATGLSLPTIRRGMRELVEGCSLSPERTRNVGGGRRKAIDVDPTLLPDLEGLVDSTTRGDPTSPLRWTCKHPPACDGAEEDGPRRECAHRRDAAPLAGVQLAGKQENS